MAAHAVDDQQLVVRVRFKLSLDQVILLPMIDLTPQQQKRQMSKPFERFGMHWILTIEKEAAQGAGGNNNGFNVLVVLYCLSVPIVDQDARDNHPLKGNITVDDQVAQDGQARTFNAQAGIACNLVGKQFPADAVHLETFKLSLRSGGTDSGEVEVSMYSEEGIGGYYGKNWRGAGGILLENHVFDGVRDGAGIEVTLRFQGQPRALRYVD